MASEMSQGVGKKKNIELFLCCHGSTFLLILVKYAEMSLYTGQQSYLCHRQALVSAAMTFFALFEHSFGKLADIPLGHVHLLAGAPSDKVLGPVKFISTLLRCAVGQDIGGRQAVLFLDLLIGVLCLVHNFQKLLLLSYFTNSRGNSNA